MNEPESKKALNETEEEAISGGAFTKAAFRKSGKEPAAGITPLFNPGQPVTTNDIPSDEPRDGGATLTW